MGVQGLWEKAPSGELVLREQEEERNLKKKKKKQQRGGAEERRGAQLFLLDERSQCSKPTVGFGMAMECFGGSGFIIANCTIRGK